MEIEYLVQQPEKLEDLSVKSLAEWLALQAGAWMRRAGDSEELLSRHIEDIRSLIECNVPRLLHNQLFVEGMRALNELNSKPSADVSEACKKNIICRMTESLFTKHLSVLHVDFEHSLYRKTLCLKSHLLVGLTELHLNLNASKCDEFGVVRILTEFHKLKRLYICDNFVWIHPSLSLDTTIKCIVDNCKLLEELDISGYGLRFQRVCAISELRNLKRINIERNILVPITEIVKILKSCKNVEYILNGDTSTLVTALERFQALAAPNPTLEFNIKIFKSNKWFTFEQLQIIVSTCPKLERIILHKILRNCPLSLIPLLDLQYLKELELSKYDFYRDQVKDVLDIRGKNFTVLSFNAVSPMSLNELMHIARTCPNLESLTISKTYGYEWARPHNTTLLGKDFKAGNPAFSKLRVLMLNDNFKFYSQIMGEELMFLLCNSPNIEVIKSSTPINDDVMSTVLNVNPLLNLRILQSCHCNLSRPVIERIIQSCTNFPEIRNIRNKS